MKNYQLEEITTRAKLRSQLADVFRERSSDNSKARPTTTHRRPCLPPRPARPPSLAAHAPHRKHPARAGWLNGRATARPARR